MPRAYHIQPEEFDLLLGESSFIVSRSLSDAEEYATRLLGYAERSGDPNLRLLAHCELSIIFSQIGLEDRGEEYMKIATELAEQQPQSSGRAIYELYTGLDTIHAGRYKEGRARYAEAERLSRALRLPMIEAWTQYALGTAAWRVGDFLGALEAALEAQRMVETLDPGGRLFGYSCILAGKACERCGLSERALEFYAHAEQILVPNSELVRGIVTLERGTLHANMREWELAHRYFDTAFTIFSTLQSPWMLSGLHSQRAFALRQQERRAEARLELDSALRIARERRGGASEMEILTDLALIEEEDGNLDAAVGYLRTTVAHHRAHGNQWGERIGLVRLARCLSALGWFEEANRTFERQMELQHELGIRTAPASMLLLLDRAGRKGREQEVQHLRMQREMLEREMRQRMHELSAMALRLRKRDELIATLERRIRSGIEEGGDGTGLLQELHGLVTVGAGDSWTDFTRQVDDVHSEFVRSLATRNPTLTPTELKVCCLLRVNLSTKEIARLLGITPKSVELYRSRIRRKLNIDQSIHLPSALLAL